MKFRGTLGLMLLALPSAAPAKVPDQAVLAEVDKFFADWRLSAHAPGLVYGVVADGRLVAVRGLGVQDPQSATPVTADSLFRIASMSKAFTALAILKLRDEGKLSLDAPAERYVPEMKSWVYPTSDSPKITVRNLLTHTAGFVEDNPWGDRQQVLTEPEFTAILKSGVPFSRAPGIAMEYSNLGYATLGRIVSNVSGTRASRIMPPARFSPIYRQIGHALLLLGQKERIAVRRSTGIVTVNIVQFFSRAQALSARSVAWFSPNHLSEGCLLGVTDD